MVDHQDVTWERGNRPPARAMGTQSIQSTQALPLPDRDDMETTVKISISVVVSTPATARLPEEQGRTQGSPITSPTSVAGSEAG